MVEGSLYSLALLSNAESHALSLGPNSDETGNAAAIWSRDSLNTHVDKAIFLKLAFGVEVADQEPTLLILFSDRSHQLDIQSLSEVLNVLSQMRKRSVDLYLVFPLIVSPLLLEIKLSAVRREKLIDEINLNLVDVNDVGKIATCRIEGQVAIDGTVICRVHLQTRLERLGGQRSETRNGKGLLHKLEIALRE